MDAPRGAVAVLSEALCLARRSRNHMLTCLLLALIPGSLQLVGGHVSAYSLLLGVIARLHALGREQPVTPRFYDLLLRLKSDADFLSHANVALAAASHLGYFASTVAIVHAASAACAGRHLPVRDLPPKLAASWKGPLVTYLYSTLLSVGYTSLSVSLIAVPALNMAAAGGPSSRLAAVAAAAVAAAARFLYIYLGMVWAVGVVVSVVEDGCRGLEALHRAGEAVRARRAQGFLIALALAVANASVGFGGSGRGALGWRDALACAVRILLGMFSPMVYTVFYHECKRSHGDGAPKELSHRTKAEHDHGTSSEGVV
ncbi:hypothetical protein PAHAL_6G220900 [Panicum hallii]|uniref:Uncharacterized protein n=1 Tax=Panicum hallii TaxID=206008 RepID=A0A2S3I2X5_9POAL|nr:uncharacterized protein LOC112897468 [Panicum hallii]PAN35600.1 hypothetical protein PAHAL_6G220900 [Panicum hallii]